jgi:hypothetical protein
VVESFVASMPQLAAALSVWGPVASGAEEVLKVGAPLCGAWLWRAVSSPPDPDGAASESGFHKQLIKGSTLVRRVVENIVQSLYS